VWCKRAPQHVNVPINVLSSSLQVVAPCAPVQQCIMVIAYWPRLTVRCLMLYIFDTAADAAARSPYHLLWRWLLHFERHAALPSFLPPLRIHSPAYVVEVWSSLKKSNIEQAHATWAIYIRAYMRDTTICYCYIHIQRCSLLLIIICCLILQVHIHIIIDILIVYCFLFFSSSSSRAREHV